MILLFVIFNMRGEEKSRMGNSLKDGKGHIISLKTVFSEEYMKTYFQGKQWRKISHDALNVASIISENDQDRKKYSMIFEGMANEKDFNPDRLEFDRKKSRAIATFLGLGICDALGASTQFTCYDKQRKIIFNGFSDIIQLIKKGLLQTRSGRVGIWTDDCSMALSMADSLIFRGYKFDPVNIRYMFILWLEHGLNNGGRAYSIGLGGNISISINQFMQEQTEYAVQGDRFNNGNGALMRLAPVPLCFNKNEEEAMKFSGLSSMTTHNGEQSKECCRLLALILVRLINRQDQDWRQCLDKACKDFQTSVASVKFLALSQAETEELYNQQIQRYGGKFKKFNKLLEDRDWNWKNPDFTYSPTRSKAQPGYIGSYCMDALAMALHSVWTKKSFFQIALFNTNIGGDCDTVGAIAGQIAGAIYGVDHQMLKLYSEMVDFTQKRYEVFLKAYKLFNHGPVQ